MSEQHENHEKPSHKTVWERDTLERLAFATLAEQRATRRWRIFFRFAWLALIIALFWTGAHKGGMGGANPSQPHTAVVAIKGEIADGADASASAWLEVKVDGVNVLKSKLVSDTLFGDEMNDVPLGTNGAQIKNPPTVKPPTESANLETTSPDLQTL